MSEQSASPRWGLIILLLVVGVVVIGLVGYFLGMEWAGGVTAASLVAGKILRDKDRALIEDAREKAGEASVSTRAALRETKD